MWAWSAAWVVLGTVISGFFSVPGTTRAKPTQAATQDQTRTNQPESTKRTEQQKTPSPKLKNQMEWVGWMNNIRQRVTEIINEEIVYSI